MRLSDYEITLGEPRDGQASGIADRRGLAAALNSRGVRTARGGRWHVSNVKNVIDRSGANGIAPSTTRVRSRCKPRRLRTNNPARALTMFALALNSRGVRMARGRRWHVSNVKNVIYHDALQWAGIFRSAYRLTRSMENGPVVRRTRLLGSRKRRGEAWPALDVAPGRASPRTPGSYRGSQRWDDAACEALPSSHDPATSRDPLCPMWRRRHLLLSQVLGTYGTSWCGRERLARRSVFA